MPLKYFHDNLNIAGIVTPVCDFFYAKCTQFSLTFMELN